MDNTVLLRKRRLYTNENKIVIAAWRSCLIRVNGKNNIFAVDTIIMIIIIMNVMIMDDGCIMNDGNAGCVTILDGKLDWWDIE